MSGVRLSAIAKTFIDPSGRRFEALKGIDLEIRGGESFSLLGPSGCGKSTLLRIISGIETPDSGAVFIDERDVTNVPSEKRETAMVFQNYALFPHLSVEGNVAFGLKLRKKSRQEIKAKVEQVLDLVQLRGLKKRRMDELSGGQQQRVALARVLAIEPSILLMDEPLSNLDAALRRTTRAAIRCIQADLRLTLIYVTHDQEEALMISDRLALMKEGRILQVGTPREVYDSPASAEVARFFGQRNMIPAVLESFEGSVIRVFLAESKSRASIAVEAQAEKNSFKPGDPVWLALKTDDIVLRPSGDSPASSGWLAEVLLVSFAGSSEEIEIRLNENGEVLRVIRNPREDADHEFRRGDSVDVSIGSRAGIIYPRRNEEAVL